MNSLDDEMRRSFSKNPKTNGSYLRVVQDIERVLADLKIDDAPEYTQYIFYYSACEKLVSAMDGISRPEPTSKIFARGYQLHLENAVKGCAYVDFQFDSTALSELFGPTNSVRELRNTFVHQIGPSHMKKVIKDAPRMVPKMKDFLTGIRAVEIWIAANGTD